MSLHAVPADTPDLRRALFALRYRAYVEAQGYDPPGADHSRRVLTDSLDETSESFVLLDGDEAVGSLRVTALERMGNQDEVVRRYAMAPAVDAFGLPAICLTSRFVFAAARSNPSGVFRLMEMGYGWARRDGRRLAYGDCSPPLLGFYRHMGYRTYAGAFVDPSYGQKWPLLLVLGDGAWLGRVRSPLARCASRHPHDATAAEWFRRTYDGSEPSVGG